jgi:hypothetical protein
MQCLVTSIFHSGDSQSAHRFLVRFQYVHTSERLRLIASALKCMYCLYRSPAFSKIAPPSELLSGWSNWTTKGRSKIPGKRTHCVVVCSLKQRSPIGLKTASITALYHEEAFRVSKNVHYPGYLCGSYRSAIP